MADQGAGDGLSVFVGKDVLQEVEGREMGRLEVRGYMEVFEIFAEEGGRTIRIGRYKT